MHKTCVLSFINMPPCKPSSTIAPCQKLCVKYFINMPLCKPSSAVALCQNPFISQMDLREKAVNRNELRDVFGVTVPAFDIQRGLYSHESPECGGIAVKCRQFERVRAEGILNTFESAKVNKATFLISTKPENATLEKQVHTILSAKEPGEQSAEAINNRFNRVFQVNPYVWSINRHLGDC